MRLPATAEREESEALRSAPLLSPLLRSPLPSARRHPLARARCRIDASMRERERERDTLL